MANREPHSVEKYALLDNSAIWAGLERLRKRGRLTSHLDSYPRIACGYSYGLGGTQRR